MQQEDKLKPGLFGIQNSNRSNEEFWGKNQFNSSFPAALACWMRHSNINPVYVHIDEKNQVVSCDKTISFNDVFKSNADFKDLTFDFEAKFNPFSEYVFDSLEAIDLVISEKDCPKRALEVKLTVLPDQTTYQKSEENWGCELVIRPVSIIYSALTMYNSIKNEGLNAKKNLEKTALNISDWTNIAEIASKKGMIVETLKIFLNEYRNYQGMSLKSLKLTVVG